MQLLTYAQARDRLLLETDLTNETFITADEMVSYFNEAIDTAEAEICKTYEEYFLTVATLTMAQGVGAISLPSGIYANKIRGVVYINGSEYYAVKRVRGEDKFLNIEATNAYGTSDLYQYYTRWDDTTTGVKLTLVPPARVSGAFLKLYYLRNANRVPLISGGTQAATDATIIDIPEFIAYILQFVKLRIYEKEGGPRSEDAIKKVEYYKDLMIETLSDMVQDNDDTIIPDTSHYEEHS